MNSIKRIFITAILFLAFLPARASHLAGHDMTYRYIQDTVIAGDTVQEYEITLSIYQDYINGSPEAIAQDNPAYLGVFNAVTGALVKYDTNVNYTSSYAMPITVTGPCDSGGTFIPMGILRKTFIKDYYLRPSTSGYTITYQRCCLIGSLVNINAPGNDGITAMCTIPPSGIATTNNSAIFTNYPPFVIPIDYPLTFDCSATDEDGDSLSYSFCASISGANDASNAKPLPAAPPYDSNNYIYPLSSNNQMNCSVPLKLDSITGQLTCTPNTIGRYLMDVCCKEWRSGVLINTVYREFEFIVTDCPLPPTSFRKAAEDIFPNPAIETITVVSAEAINQISLTNAFGKKFDVPWSYITPLGVNLNEHDLSIDISSLDPGVYFLKVNNGTIKKFMKQWQSK